MTVDFDGSGELSVTWVSAAFDAAAELAVFGTGRDGIGLNDPNAVIADAILYVSDLTATQTYAVVNPFGLEQEMRFDQGEGLNVLRWEIPATDAAVPYIADDYLVTYDGIVYTVTVVEPTRDTGSAFVQYEAEALWVRLGLQKMVGDFVLTAKTPDQGLTTILSGSGWTAATVGSATTYGVTLTDASVLELVRQWAVVCGYEVSFDTVNKIITFSTTIGTTSALAVRYGRNLKGIKKRTEPPRCTKLYAFGRNNLPLAAKSVTDFTYYTGLGLSLPAAQASFTKVDTWTDDSIVDVATLTARANQRIALLAQPKVTYEVDVADVSVLTGYNERYHIGDSVRVTDADLSIDVATRVSRLIRRPLDPARSTVELAASFDPADSSNGTASRGGLGDSWYLLRQRSTATRTVGSSLTLQTILGVTFAESVGKAVYGVDFEGTSTGTGTLEVRLYDERAAADVRTVDYVFTSGQAIHIPIVYSNESLSGDYLYSVRAQVTSGSGTIAIAVGGIDEHILVQGGLGVAVPPSPTSVTFQETDGTQDWTVPTDVTVINIDAYGSHGGNTVAPNVGGYGGRVLSLRVPVTAGEILRMQWAGAGGGGTGSAPGGGGGNATTVRRSPYAFSDSLVIAAGGGGAGGSNAGAGSAGNCGGGGGYTDGLPATTGSPIAGGASQIAGGTAGGFFGVNLGTDGSSAQGGHGYNVGGSGAGGGGGGGGLYGGGGGGEATGAGGGSSHESGTGAAVLYESGTWSTTGQVTISWT